jgi:benzoyl-CoA reductase/2-hydroxyglutaryl-CoA dehydratase subunit BcrC/BadD/HgdB
MLNHASFYSDVNSLSEILRDYYQELKKKKDAQVKSRCRVLLTGSTLAAGDYKVVDILEASGAAIVIEEMGEGIRHYWDLVEPDGDLIVALADRYFRKKVSPAFFRPSRDRVDWVIKLAEDFKVDGVVWYQLMYRESYDVQSYYFAKILKEKLGIPMLKVQSDYDVTEYTQLKNKIETFVEVIGR